MNSKTFKSAKSTLSLTVVRTNEDLVRIITQLPDETGRAIDLERCDVPAMMQALAEAAGVPMQGDFTRARAGTPGHLSFIAQHLEQYVVASEHITAEAKEQAELEAEALELFRASQCIRTDGMYASVPSFAALTDPSKTKWLAVARKAREIAGGK